MGNVLIRRGQPDRRHVFAALVAIVFLGGASAVPANAIDDRSPPTQPGPITTSALTSSSVSLAWRASSDDVRVVGYRIYRGAASVPDSDLTLIATIDAITTYKATALYSGTSYKFGVVAIDLANNASPIRTAVVSTLSSSDTAPPAAPSSSSVSGTAFSESRIDVVWGGSGSTDVAGYLVYRNGAQVGRIDLPGGLRFSDNGLAASTSYDYALKAVDSAGNLSAGTTPRAVKTLAAGAVKIARGPYVSNVTKTSAIVSWWTNRPTPSTVRFGVSSSSEQVVVDSAPVQQHTVSLAGLNPGTTYVYDVISPSGTESVSSSGTFVTAAIPGTSFTFAAISDFGGGSPGAAQNAANIASAGTAFLQTLGDNIYPSSGFPDPDFATTYSDYDARFFKPFAAAIRSQAFLPANGDKEYFSDGAFWRVFPMLGSNHSWYSYDWGNAHILVIDSEQPFATGSEQYQFIADDLAANQAAFWRIVVIQRPPYSSTTTASSSLPVRQYLVPLFQQYNVALVLSGNSHNYERTVPLVDGSAAPNGVTYIVSGAGGNGLNKFVLPQPAWTAFRDDTTYEYIRVAVSPKSLRVEAIASDTNGIFDSVTIDRQNGDTAAPTAPADARVSDSTRSSVSLKWSPSSDDVGVSSYYVYRGSAYAGATTGESFVVSELECGTTYTFGIEAVDASGNISPRSTVTGATTACEPSATLTFAPVADAQVREANPTGNYGNSPSLSSDSGTGSRIESYLRFAVDGIYAGHVVTSATLRVYVPVNGTVDAPAVYSVSDTAWVEQTISWDTRPARAPTATDDAGAVPAGTWMEFDVTPLVTGKGTFSFCIGPTPTGDGTDYSSREVKTISNRPELVVATASDD